MAETCEFGTSLDTKSDILKSGQTPLPLPSGGSLNRRHHDLTSLIFAG
jgi:hypothetical protein